MDRLAILILWLFVLAGFGITIPQLALAQQSDSELKEQARQLLSEAPLIDGHNDLAWQFRVRADYDFNELDIFDTGDLENPMHTDIPRLREGKVGGQFWSVYVPTHFEGADAVQAVQEQIDFIHRLTNRYSDHFELALTAGDIERIHGEGKIASLIGAEGGHTINNSPAVLRSLYRQGVRYMTLTHSDNTDWADSATDEPDHGGLTTFGKQLIREMNRLGMLADLSHVTPETMEDAIEVSEAPVIFSHSSARGVTDHIRNVPDKILQQVQDTGGIVMVTYVTPFISEELRKYRARKSGAREKIESLYPDRPEMVKEEMNNWKDKNPKPEVTIEHVANHIDYIRNEIGIEHVGIGADYDGTSDLPAGLEDASTYPALFAELLERGYGEEAIKKLAGQNILRVMRKAEHVSDSLREVTEPLVGGINE